MKSNLLILTKICEILYLNKKFSIKILKYKNTEWMSSIQKTENSKYETSRKETTQIKRGFGIE